MRPRLKWIRKPEPPGKKVLDYRAPGTEEPTSEKDAWTRSLGEMLATFAAEIFAQIVIPIAVFFGIGYYMMSKGCN